MESEGVDFERRLGTLLPVIEKEINPENFKDVSNLLSTKCWEMCMKKHLGQVGVARTVFKMQFSFVKTRIRCSWNFFK